MKYVYEYPRPMVTVDILLWRYYKKKIEILLIRRGQPPFQGKWALPGGFIRMDETLEESARRELRQIPTNSVVGLGFYPINTVFAFNTDNIWMFSNAGSYCHWNGTIWQSQYVPERQGGINKIWGSSLTDIYFVGPNGSITYYNGSSWQKLESSIGAGGTELPIQDIWGAKNENSEQEEIYCIASTKYYGDVSRVMKIDNNKIVEVSNTGLPCSISGIWFKPPHDYYIVGDGVFYTTKLNQHSQWIELVDDITGYYTNVICGNNINNVFMAGDYNTVIHFNGMSWKNYQNNELPSIPTKLLRLDVKNGLVVIVGYLSGNVIIIKGVRKN